MLLVLTALERRDILSCKAEPLTTHTTLLEALVPVTLDPRRIIRFYNMNVFQFLRQDQRDLSSTPSDIVGSADFIISAVFN